MKEILVYADWLGLPECLKIGNLRSEISRGEEVFSFAYDETWLQSGFAQDLDPDLRLFTGPQYVNDDKPNFGVFLDSSPDRWGKMLMERREAIQARVSRTTRRRLSESDFLLGAGDETRMGALRYKTSEDGEFLADREDMDVPPFTRIRELEQASLGLEDDSFFENKEAINWLSMLLSPGSSLGGARPKANVLDPEGQMWIAKFPSKHDQKNTGGWEALVNQMAHEIGIKVASGKAIKFSQQHDTYLTKRFDRTTDNKRIHFASALCLLGYKDGYNHKSGGNYLELVELIEQFGCDPNEDIRELWQRIVFSVAVSNTDDHLSNHGFLLTENGWKLSPAYDINPEEKGTGLSLNISEDDNSLDFDLCLSVIEYFRWKKEEAHEFIQKTKQIVSQWKKRAQKLKIPDPEQIRMESAFVI